VAIAEVELPPGWASTAEEEGRWAGRPKLAHLRIVHVASWRGRSHMGQVEALGRLLDEEWRCRAVAMDATGLGAMPCALLAQRMGERVTPVVFTGAVKSELGYGLIAAANAGRVRMYMEDEAEGRETWAQLRAVRRVLRGEGQMSWGARSGHDDLAVAVALCVKAAEGVRHEAAGAMVLGRPVYRDGRY
jgi:hypothetical protein